MYPTLSSAINSLLPTVFSVIVRAHDDDAENKPDMSIVDRSGGKLAVIEVKKPSTLPDAYSVPPNKTRHQVERYRRLDVPAVILTDSARWYDVSECDVAIDKPMIDFSDGGDGYDVWGGNSSHHPNRQVNRAHEVGDPRREEQYGERDQVSLTQGECGRVAEVSMTVGSYRQHPRRFRNVVTVRYRNGNARLDESQREEYPTSSRDTTRRCHREGRGIGHDDNCVMKGRTATRILSGVN